MWKNLITDVDAPLTKQLSEEQIAELCKMLPKIELHSHLSGCVRPETLSELLKAAGEDPGAARFQLSAVSATHSMEDTWKETVEAFETIRRLTAYDVTVLKRVIMEAVEDFAKDGCMYLELRTGLKKLPDRRTFLSEVVSTLEVAQGKNNIVVRLLVSVDRGASVEDAKETIDVAIEAFKAQGKEMIVGVEMGGNPLRGDWAQLEPHFARARAAGLKVSLHFAENKGCSAEHRRILAFAPERVGHAVYMDAGVARALRESKIPVEVCVTCHEAYYKVAAARNVLGWLLGAGHCAVLCCDNPALLNTSLSREYARAILTFALSPRQLHRLVMGSLEGVFCEGGSQTKLSSLFRIKLLNLLPPAAAQRDPAKEQTLLTSPPPSAGFSVAAGAGAVVTAAAVALVAAALLKAKAPP